MSGLNVKHKDIPIYAKHLVLWGVALIVAICCAAAIFLQRYSEFIADKTESKELTTFSSDSLADYDPYLYSKNYLAVAESGGFEVDLDEVTRSAFCEFVLEGEYTVEYYKGKNLVASGLIANDSETVVYNSADARKKVVFVPDGAVEAGYDRVVLRPYSGSVFTLCYFHTLDYLDDSVVLQAYEGHTHYAAYFNAGAGSQYDVPGLFAFLADWDTDTIHLQLESATSELDMELIDVENEQGEVLAEFPENSVLAKVVNGDVYLAEYSLPLIADSYEVYDVYVRYRYEGASEVKLQKVNPFVQDNEEVYESTEIRTLDNMAVFDNLAEVNGQVYFTEEYVVLDQSLFIPKGLEFVILAGQTIDFHNDAFIISRSPISVEGTEDNPVLITSTDDSENSGIAVLQASERSTCSYMVCDNLGELSSGVYHLTGAVTFYESDVDFYDCQFLNNRSEDGLNTVRCDITVNDCTFKNTYQDAFDSDFCTGTFTGCYFESTGNDAFDVSTSEFTLINTTFSNISDKAVSVGEASTVTIETMYAQDVQTGIGAKDSSVVTASNVTIENALIGFCAYQKKPEYGASTITVDGYSLEGSIDFDYLIEEDDTLIVNGEQWFASQKKKQALIIERLINEEPIN